MRYDDGYSFSECPNCGSTERVVESEIEDAVRKGLAKEDAWQAVLQTEAIIADPECIPQIIGAKVEAVKLLGYYDVCCDCGTLYCVRMERKPIAVGTQIKAPRGQMGPFFGKG